jgi:hypothetical protein
MEKEEKTEKGQWSIEALAIPMEGVTETKFRVSSFLLGLVTLPISFRTFPDD